MRTIIVIGGGPAGATAARLLAKHGYDVSLISQAQNQDFRVGETLPPVSNPLLERLGLLDCLHQGPHIPCPGNQSIFGTTNIVDFDFIFSSNGMGWHLDRVMFEEQLLSLTQSAGVRVVNNTKVTSIDFVNNQWAIGTLSSIAAGEPISGIINADYIIDASGRSRVLLKNLGVDIIRFDKLAARTVVFKTKPSPRDHRTLIESTQHGWWYSACIPNDMRVVMYFSDSDLKEFRALKKPQNFLKKLSSVDLIFDRLNQELLSEIDVESVIIRTYACSSAYAQSVQGENWIAIGDAIMSFDALSSQGLWTALEGADRAVQAILNQEKYPQASIRAYSDWVEQTFSRYLTEKHNYYSMESRWKTHEFWQRRVEAP